MSMEKELVIALSYKYKYGEFADSQVEAAKIDIRKSVFFLLLCVDPETKSEYENIDVNEAFKNLSNKIAGLNSLFGYPSELVNVQSLIECARLIYNADDFNFKDYRKLILDAGAEVMRLPSCVEGD